MTTAGKWQLLEKELCAMKNLQKFGLITAVLLCAAMVMVPMVAAAGPGQSSQAGDEPG